MDSDRACGIHFGPACGGAFGRPVEYPTSGETSTDQEWLGGNLYVNSAVEVGVPAVNHGVDADSIVSKVAGAKVGAPTVPDPRQSAVDETRKLERLAAQLVEVA